MQAAVYCDAAPAGVHVVTLPKPSLAVENWVPNAPFLAHMAYRLVFDVVLPVLRLLFPTKIPPPYGSNKTRSMLLLQVKAAAVNPVDAKFLYGDKFPAFLSLIKRFLERRVCGIDVAGVVISADPSSPYVAGDELYGTVPPGLGSFASVVRVPSDFLYYKPLNLSFVEAAAVPLVGLTIAQIFNDHGLKAGMRLCVLGASGGTGHVAVQLGRHLGLSVTAVCGESNAAFVKSLGASDVVPYDGAGAAGDVVDKLEALCNLKGKFDVVFDAVSSHDPRDHVANYERRIRDRGLLAGTYVIVGGLKEDWIKAHVKRFLGVNLFEKGRSLHWVRFPNATPYLKQLKEIIEAGGLKPTIGQVFPLTSKGVQGAFNNIMTRRSVGKIVIDITNTTDL